MNGEAFRAYVEQVLVPELAAGDVVVMDNLPAHKVGGIREAIEQAGATLLYLPPYSPDFNPIEMAFAKLKASYARPPRGQSRNSGAPLLTPSNSSAQANAETTSLPPDMMHSDRKTL
jgi:transposase